MLPAFHLVTDIGGVIELTLLVDNNRQVTAVTDGVHSREEDETISAEKVLNVVLGSDQKHVQARFLQKLIYAMTVERNCGARPHGKVGIHLALLAAVQAACFRLPK